VVNYLLCFSNLRFRLSAQILMQSASKFGINNIVHRKFEEFSETDFCKQHIDICKEPFGAGFYIWKPYYILEMLQQMNEGELLLYMDAGHVLVNDPAPLFDLAQTKNIVLFTNEQGFPYLSATKLPFTYDNCYFSVNSIRFWCKGDAIEALDADSQNIMEYPMVDASLMLFKRNEFTLNFCQKWLNYCSIRSLISWDESKGAIANKPGFVKHIYDQSILSLMAAKMQLELFRCPSQFGNHRKLLGYRVEDEYCILPYASAPMENSPYGSITHHHRSKKKTFSKRLKDFIQHELVLLNYSYFAGNSRIIKKLIKTNHYQVLGINIKENSI